jgi:hypothetical protein
MGVADTEAAVTLVAVTLLEVTSAALASAEAGTMCTLEGPMCMLAEPMFASPEATASEVIAAVGPAAVGLAGTGVGVMADPMPMTPATRTAGCFRPATGRNELKPMGVLNAHWRRTKARACSPLSLADDGRAVCFALRAITSRERKRSSHPKMHSGNALASGAIDDRHRPKIANAATARLRDHRRPHSVAATHSQYDASRHGWLNSNLLVLRSTAD